MNDQHFDDANHRVSAARSSHLTRRDVLRWLGLGSAGAMAGTIAADVNGTTAEIEAAPAVQAVDQFRRPGGPTVEQLARELEYDPTEIFRYVAEEISYEAYSGVLRGAQGTLWSFAGNSVDQSALLAALLKEALVATRFVIGELEDDVAARVTYSMRRDEVEERALARRIFTPPESSEPAQSPDLTPEQEDLLRSLPELQRLLLDTVKSQLADGVGTVQANLATAQVALPDPTLQLPSREIRQHVWLQYADGPRWIDLDPSVPGAKVGETFATPITIVDDLPEDFFHRVSFRLAAEKVTAGVPTRSDLLTFEAASHELVGLPVTLTHAKPDTFKAVGVSVTESIEGYLNYLPLFVVGDQVIGGAPVTFATGECALDVLGDESRLEGDTLGEWLEIDVRSPDGGNRSIMREIFDRVGIAQRGNGQVDLTRIPPTDFVVLDETGQSYLPLLAVWSIGVVTGAIPAGYFDQDPTVQDQLADVASLIHAYHYTRDVLALETVDFHGHRFYHDEPNLTALTITPIDLTADGGTLSIEIDLLHRSFATVPIEGYSVAVHPHVAAGVFTHVVERTMIEGVGVAPSTLPPLAYSGVGLVFEEAHRQGISVKVLRPTDADDSRLPGSDEATIRMADALEQGYVIIVPERPVSLGGVERIGWWQVDPATGETIDQMDNGKGVTGTDYSLFLRILQLLQNPYARIGACIATFAFGVSAGLFTAAAIATAAEGGPSSSIFSNLGGAFGSVGSGALTSVACAVS